MKSLNIISAECNGLHEGWAMVKQREEACSLGNRIRGSPRGHAVAPCPLGLAAPIRTIAACDTSRAAPTRSTMPHSRPTGRRWNGSAKLEPQSAARGI
eukprot:3332431-Prymnesium_polylepis.4